MEKLKNAKEKAVENNKKETQNKKRGGIAKPMILVASAAVIGLSVYADWNYSRKEAEDVGGYIYNSAVSGEKAKILGEATYVGSTDDVSTESESDGYFASVSLERTRSRDEALELLQTIVDSSESMPDAKNKALEDMTAIASYMEAETNIETLIKAKGFNDCIAVVNGDEANIVVGSAGLLTYEVAQIREIVMNELNIPADKIKIIEKTSN